MAAQIGQMIGGAEFMLILDKPFEAEKLFGAILSMDPNNAYATQGLERVKVAKRPNWTFLMHPFTFPKLDQSMFTYGGGPSFYSKNLKSTFWIGDGWYKNDINPNNPDNPLGFLGNIIGTADDKALSQADLQRHFRALLQAVRRLLLPEPHHVPGGARPHSFSTARPPGTGSLDARVIRYPAVQHDSYFRTISPSSSRRNRGPPSSRRSCRAKSAWRPPTR